MSFWKSVTLVGALLLASLSVNSQAAMIGVDNNFEDNGLTVLEYRSDGSIWEWLDLSVTNGISYNSLVADLNDDGRLNNSTSLLITNTGALNDVLNLAPDLSNGWSTVASADLTGLFGTFFGLTLVGNEQVTIGNGASDLTEQFILAFGDTVHEASEDSGATINDVNPNLPNIGETRGYTNTAVGNRGKFRSPFVLDGQTSFQFNDNVTDILSFNATNTAQFANATVGTWLVREVATIPTPSILSLFALSLVALCIRRKKWSK
ncbi:hypothetical protein DXX93_02095 [Thalassotalea euphylliae]|uniref:PEP-CTERM sorting domain-containing protein n=1 Tax=Thalassotalea euphylliae TaxID=1655234 RepID=A0A3E0TMG3_9GAMM|nr:hypothetical protein [Thalassotalea euphylliae]REL25460.1 hypothetical protein DXX93_02095 [Thalassotalea euphylliae]